MYFRFCRYSNFQAVFTEALPSKWSYSVPVFTFKWECCGFGEGTSVFHRKYYIVTCIARQRRDKHVALALDNNIWSLLGNDSVNTLKRAAIEAVSQWTNIYYSLLGNSQRTNEVAG
jgi:hypothetical protein